MEAELVDECDYRREAHFIRTFGATEKLGSDTRFRIPWVWGGSTSSVLVMQRMDGVSVGGNVVDSLTQEDRNEARVESAVKRRGLRMSLIDRQTDFSPMLQRTIRV